MSTPARRAIVASPVSEWRCWTEPVPGPPTLGVHPCGLPGPARFYSVVVSVPEALEGALRVPQRPETLALALLVPRVALADHHDIAVTTNHAAVLTDRLDAGVYLHCVSLFAVFVPVPEGAGRYFPADVTCSGRRSDHGSGR